MGSLCGPHKVLKTQLVVGTASLTVLFGPMPTLLVSSTIRALLTALQGQGVGDLPLNRLSWASAQIFIPEKKVNCALKP